MRKSVVRIVVIAVAVAITAIGISVGAAAEENCWGNAICA